MRSRLTWIVWTAVVVAGAVASFQIWLRAFDARAANLPGRRPACSVEPAPQGAGDRPQLGRDPPQQNRARPHWLASRRPARPLQCQPVSGDRVTRLLGRDRRHSDRERGGLGDGRGDCPAMSSKPVPKATPAPSAPSRRRPRRSSRRPRRRARLMAPVVTPPVTPPSTGEPAALQPAAVVKPATPAVLTKKAGQGGCEGGEGGCQGGREACSAKAEEPRSNRPSPRARRPRRPEERAKHEAEERPRRPPSARSMRAKKRAKHDAEEAKKAESARSRPKSSAKHEAEKAQGTSARAEAEKREARGEAQRRPPSKRSTRPRSKRSVRRRKRRRPPSRHNATPRRQRTTPPRRRSLKTLRACARLPLAMSESACGLPLSAIAASTASRSNGTRRNAISSAIVRRQSMRAYAANASTRRSSSGCTWSYERPTLPGFTNVLSP